MLDAKLLGLEVLVLAVNRRASCCIVLVHDGRRAFVLACARGHNFFDKTFTAHDHPILRRTGLAVGQQAFEFLLGLQPAPLLILTDQRRAFQLLNSVPQNDVLELQLFGFVLPRIDLTCVVLVLNREQLVALLQLVQRCNHVNALTFVDAERSL